MRLYTGIAVMIVLLATIAVLGSLERPGVSGEALPPRLHVDLIAVVDEDRRILTIEPDGSKPSLLTPASGGDPQLYTWPTWSPDARSLAITKVVGSSGPPVVSLERVNLETGDTATIHSGFVQPMAVGVFYYPMWSPDGSRLAFIVSEGEGLRLFVDIVDDAFAPNPVLDNGPLWMSWSPDSRRLLVHRADSHFLVEALEDRVDVLSLGNPVRALQGTGLAAEYRQGDVPRREREGGLLAVQRRGIDGGRYRRERAAGRRRGGRAVSVVAGRPGFGRSRSECHLRLPRPDHRHT